MFLLGGILTLLRCLSHSYIPQGRKRWLQHQHFFLLFLSLNLSITLTWEFNCSSWCQSERSFFWFSWLFFFFFFWNSNVFPLLKVKTDLAGEQPVFFSFHKLAGLVGDWQLRILQVSVKLFIGCIWVMKLCQLVWYFRAAAIAGHKQTGFWNKIHLAWSPKFNRVSCVPSPCSCWRENDIYRLHLFSPWGKICSQILWKQLPPLTKISGTACKVVTGEDRIFLLIFNPWLSWAFI